MKQIFYAHSVLVNNLGKRSAIINIKSGKGLYFKFTAPPQTKVEVPLEITCLKPFYYTTRSKQPLDIKLNQKP